MYYPQYLISKSEPLSPDHVPKVVTEMDAIREMIDSGPLALNTDMLLSFLMDHRMETTRVNNNAEMAEMISCKTITIGDTEALFMCSSHNEDFRKQLIAYVRDRCEA